MAIRTTSAEVEAILGDNYDGATVMTPFIRAANVLVNWVANVCDTEAVNDSDALLEIETWLAAHFYGHHDQMLASKSTGKASGSFQGTTAMCLSSTYYGQTAMTLDASGCLAKRSKEAEEGARRVVGMTWLGSTNTEARGYPDTD